MLNLISTKLAELMVSVQLLSLAVAALPPAEYEIAPISPPVLETREYTTQGQIRSLIADKAQRDGVPQVLALSIAYCESRFDPKAKNPSSTASGLAQFIKSTWRETMLRMDYPTSSNVFDPELHTEAFIWLLKEDGTSHWSSSKSCWSKML